MKIKFIIPITTKIFEIEAKEEAMKFISKDTEIDVECIEYGTTSIESVYDVYLCAPGIIKIAETAQSEGFDGVFISCMMDPALHAVREMLDIPVVGACRPSMMYAGDLAHKFSVVTVLKNIQFSLENIAREICLDSKLVSVRSVNIPVLDLSNKEKLINALIEESKKAINEDGAHAIILGCTGMTGVNEILSKSLLLEGYKIPIIYPLSIGLKYLETLIFLKLSQSKMTYMYPPEKERNIWGKIK